MLLGYLLSDKLGEESGENSPHIVAFQQPGELVDAYPGRLLRAGRPAECLVALEPLDDLHPAVSVPDDRLDGLSASATKNKHRLVERLELHLVLDYICEAGGPLTHVGEVGTDVEFVFFESDVHVFLLNVIQE